ncbi:MAG: HEAT repeat domain-containing protein [Candidatus Freyarchaeota archaeon]
MTNDSSGDENDGRVLTEADIKRMRKQGDVEGLINALTYKRKTKIRFDAARALGEMGDLRAVEPLMEAVKDENRDVRWAAARALGELKDLRAVEPLIQALKDEGSDVRKAAIWALGELGDVGAVELLIEVLRNDIWGLRLEAARALAKIGDARAIEPLREFLEGEYDIVVQEALWDLENRKREEEN